MPWSPLIMLRAMPAYKLLPRLAVQHHTQRLAEQGLVRHASSCYNGVSWHRLVSKFQAQVFAQRQHHHVGYFDSEEEAAVAYDEMLRSLCTDAARLKKSLNFPTLLEARFRESPQEARSRGLARHAGNENKEEISYCRLQTRILSSAHAPNYQLERVAGSSRSDALFKPIGSDMGIRLQIKSATARGRAEKSYSFSGTAGYGGMLLVLVALDRDLIWTVPGTMVKQKRLSITLGTDRDKDWRAFDLSATLAQYCCNRTEFPHASLGECRLACAKTHKIEEQAHLQMAAVFARAGFHLLKSLTVAVVDSTLSGCGHIWRVQEKASHLHTRGSCYQVHLGKHAGALGHVAYAESDFDLLLAAILDDGRLVGLFGFPVRLLAQHRLVGKDTKAKTLRLCPPWALPKTAASQMKYAWQMDFFVDLRRSWKGEPAPSAQAHSCLQGLLHQLTEYCEADGKS